KESLIFVLENDEDFTLLLSYFKWCYGYEVNVPSFKIKHSKQLSTCFLQDDYSWRTTSVGDEFSADYNCYSLRNVQYQSKESSFPFELWNKLIDSLQ
ncbi:hypothetical protein, partial [Phocoenobacter skyensis]|uniref:hypothetical protein n=1 Tax=Phocoenobacter skyensis TaxID=97481 RepID=UPI001C43382C